MTFLKSLFGKAANKPAARQQSSAAFMEAIKTDIASSEVVIYSKTYCPYCTKTKSLFASKFPSTPTTVVELDKVENGLLIQKALAEMTGQRTVPSVWVKGDHIGGNDDTHHLFNQGKLSQILEASE